MNLRVEYRPFLYLGDKISLRRLARLKRQIARQPAQSKVYLIALPDSPHSQVEIYSARWLQQLYPYMKTPRIVGMADSRKEAFELVGKITEDCLKNTGKCYLKEYLEW